MCEICDMSIRDWRLTIVLEIHVELLFLEQPRRKGSVADLSAMKPRPHKTKKHKLIGK